MGRGEAFLGGGLASPAQRWLRRGPTVPEESDEMCEPEYSDEEPTIDCPEFEDFPCPDDDDDGTAVTAAAALTKLSDLRECDWETAAGTKVFAYSEGRGEVDWWGTVYSVTASGATLSAAIGTWTIFRRGDGVYRVGAEKAAVRFVPTTGSAKARVIVQS